MNKELLLQLYCGGDSQRGNFIVLVDFWVQIL